MTKAIRTASINHNDQDGVRVILNLRNIHDGSKYPYRWYTADGDDTEVTGSTVAQAFDAAEHAWGRRTRGTSFDVWGFRARWS